MDSSPTFQDKLAKIISVVTSPYLTIPFFGLAVIATYSYGLYNFYILGATFIACAILLPFLYVLYKVRSGAVTDMHVALRGQRSGPFLVSILGSALLIFAYHREHAPKVLVTLAIVLLANACVFFLASFFSKVSIHTAAYVGSILIVTRLINPNLVFLILLLPLIIWARTKRERHTLWQTLLAAAIVVAATLAVFMYFGQ